MKKTVRRDPGADTTPQAQHPFTLFDQVGALVKAREADPNLGFMARIIALCSLPRSNPGQRKEYVRHNGPYTLVMTAGYPYKLPFGNLPRLLLAWISTEAVRTQSRELILGKSLAEFMRELDIYSTSGATYTRLKNQMQRLFNSSIRLIHKHGDGEASVGSLIADRIEFWWNERKPDEPGSV